MACLDYPKPGDGLGSVAITSGVIDMLVGAQGSAKGVIRLQHVLVWVAEGRLLAASPAPGNAPARLISATRRSWLCGPCVKRQRAAARYHPDVSASLPWPRWHPDR